MERIVQGHIEWKDKNWNEEYQAVDIQSDTHIDGGNRNHKKAKDK